jgi:hypothetical protein
MPALILAFSQSGLFTSQTTSGKNESLVKEKIKVHAASHFVSPNEVMVNYRMFWEKDRMRVKSIAAKTK